MEAAVWGLIGTAVGAAASILTTIVTARNAAHLRRETEAAERLERARAFQRETLLELQDTMQLAAKFTGRAFHASDMSFAKTGSWGSEPLPEDVDEGLRQANMRLTALIERVTDDELREACRSMHAKFNFLYPGVQRSEAHTAFGTAVLALNELMRQLGAVLRTLY
jgi:hypothetical protein